MCLGRERDRDSKLSCLLHVFGFAVADVGISIHTSGQTSGIASRIGGTDLALHHRIPSRDGAPSQRMGHARIVGSA